MQDLSLSLGYCILGRRPALRLPGAETPILGASGLTERSR